MKSQFFVGVHKDNNVVKSSSSGGAFSAIVHAWFESVKEPVVCGCVMGADLKAKHVFVESERDCSAMRGSKYIPSDINGAIQKTCEYLIKGKAVLFSGTPCQIHGLIKQIQINEINDSNLLTVEVICHGVAEYGFFKDYISNLEEKFRSKAVSCSFRAKKRKEHLQDMQVSFANGKTYNAASTKYDWFYSLYLRNLVLQKRCYNCSFANMNRAADVSLGDAWGKRENYGKSLILFNSEKAKSIQNQLFEEMDLEEVDLSEIDQPTFFRPAEKAKDYDEFWDIYKKQGYLSAQKYAGNNTIKRKVESKIVKTLDVVGLKGIIKSLMRA